MSPETLSPREVAAWRLRQRLRVNIGPNTRMLAETGQPLMLSGTEADDAVTVVLAALVEAGQVVMGASALADLVAERDHLADKVALAVEKASQRSETLYAARDRTPSDLRDKRLRLEQAANELDAIRRILEPAASRSEVRRRTIQQDGATP